MSAPSGEALKRALDVTAAAAGLVVLGPALVGIAALVKLTSPGPAIFRQERVGRDGRPFEILKFRTMTADAPGRGPEITRAGDARVTPVGRLLRRTKLDELPQLLNVLRGEMSLVGPRPEVPRYVARYSPEQRRVLSVRPGITDWASLAYLDEEDLLAAQADLEHGYVHEIMPRKLALNLEYLERRGFWSDIGILWQTARTLLGRRKL
jgi:lipopolysaccharide/colanic/teichoic acid biosynthesis glycosyltransferase